jgi:hypothetical protein
MRSPGGFALGAARVSSAGLLAAEFSSDAAIGQAAQDIQAAVDAAVIAEASAGGTPWLYKVYFIGLVSLSFALSFSPASIRTRDPLCR